MALFTTVSKNIDFLRWKFGAHKVLSDKLKGVASWAQISRFATAEDIPSPSTATAIESSLGLPIGWCNRDNLALMELSIQDYDLVTAVIRCKPSLKAALSALLESLNEEV